ncbi:MAG: hypothetical protein GY754_31450 [bacterium]|nr:hypothetical protein [bacterium]
MEVLINDYPVDFELEQERTVPDFMQSIITWAAERDLIFLEVYLDGEYYSPDNVPNMELEKIDSMNCIIQSKADMVYSTINEGARYCDRVIDFVDRSVEEKNVDISHARDLAPGIDWLVEVLYTVIQLLGLDIGDIKYTDREVIKYIDDLNRVKDELLSIDNEKALLDFLGDQGQIFFVMKDIFRILLGSEEMQVLIRQSIDSPDTLFTSLRTIKEDLPGQLKNIEEVAIAYQTGKDREASGKLNIMIEFLYRYTRTCFQVPPVFKIDAASIVVEGVSFEEKNSHLKDLLSEVTEILENNDIISLADILEYEIVPALESLEEYIDLLLEEIGGKE